MIDPPPSDRASARATRQWTLCSVEAEVDVEITARDDQRLAEVLSVLRDEGKLPVRSLWSGPHRLSDELPLTASELAHGAVLGLDAPASGASARVSTTALGLQVVGGPESGRTLPLDQGRHVLGRGAGATVRLDDPDVSRRHVELTVGGGQITVADLASTNGSHLDGRPLGREGAAWPAGAVLRLGATAITVTSPAGDPLPATPAPGGRLRVSPPRRLLAPSPHVEIALPRAPDPPAGRRLAWVAVALPAVGGVGMAWLLSTPTFLFFALLSPIVAVGTWLSERWTGRRSGRRAAAAHAAELRAARRRLTDAVAADVRASEAACPDLATLTAAVRARATPLWERQRADPDALTVRIGTGLGSARVTRIEPDGVRAPEQAAHLPVSADLRTTGLGIVGPRARTSGVLASVLAQLTALHAPGELDLLLVVAADRLSDWSWARWLPHLPASEVLVLPANGSSGGSGAETAGARIGAILARRRASSAGRSASGTGPSGGGAIGWLVVVVDGNIDAPTAARLRNGHDVGVVVLEHADVAERLPVPVGTVLRLTGETGDQGALSRDGCEDRGPIAVDRMPLSAAASFARSLAGVVPDISTQRLPRRVRLLGQPRSGLPLAAGEPVVAWERARDRLVADLGRTADRRLSVDLCTEGPHALVAGTTGSGKSELLRTLIAGLALHHPPDRCSFLLVDYKGGAAFADAVELPHTVGLVTDLDAQSTARALRSLTAELSRREAILAASAVSDIAALPDSVDLARLVIVVDEFATLAGELPAFVPGLVGIAQRGRSLGVHLILATQRPAGVVSPEIRANCTLRICLRTTDEAESRDVLGTGHAAHLPLDLPGRAFLRSGGGEPVEFQVAHVGPSDESHPDEPPTVRRTTWPFLSSSAERPATGRSDLSRITAALQQAAATNGIPPPHRPWLAALPDRLRAGDLDRFGHASSGTRLRLGLIDRPDRQQQDVLELDLAEGGGWLVVGGPRSGRTTLLRTVVGEAVRRLGPEDLHVHVLDAGGGAFAAEAADLPHTGTAIGGTDVFRTVRLIDRLAQEVAVRRAGSTPAAPPRTLLLIDGVDAVTTLLDEADPTHGSSALLRLIRDGAAVGVTCVLTADRAVPGGRLAAVARHRLVLPLADRADYAVAGVPPRAVPTVRPPGRALVDEDALECQLALPRERSGPLPPSPRHALRIVELPADPLIPAPRVPVPPGTDSLLLSIGPGGDEGHLVSVDVGRTGGLLVVGPPGSGRSAALAAFADQLRGHGLPVLRLASRSDRHAGDAADRRDPTDVRGVQHWLDEVSRPPAVVVADDLGAASDCPALPGLTGQGRRGEAAVVLAAGTAGQLSGLYQGPVATLRRNRTGLLLCPQPGDADLLGIRLPRTPLPVRPGSGWLVTGGSVQRVQVARRYGDAPPDVREAS